tara:strand:- start:176 stop:487 length:312 start_codon:yes stop_codon:yes gene_type:complete
MKKANSHECSYFGRKLGNTCCSSIEVSNGYVCIGSENDDEIYFDVINGAYTESKGMIKERVTIAAMKDGDDGFLTEIDLEDILRFAAKNCSGIYKRVLKESEE